MTLIEDPRLAPPLKWGILGPGGIARTVCEAMQAGSRQEIFAVGSRDLGRAQAFAAQFGAARAYGSYEELVSDDAVDIIYIATPHSEHCANALLAIQAGKPVMIEKPITLNSAQARRLLDAAEAAGVFVMEAMWTRFLPHLAEVRARLQAGYIGEVIALGGDFCGANVYDPSGRWYNPALGGGALLDMGVYPVSMAMDLVGQPSAVQAQATMAPSGVDLTTVATMTFPGGAQGVITTSLAATSPWEMWIAGSEGIVRIDRPMFVPAAVRFQRHGEPEEVWTFPMPARGYEYQAAEAARRIAAGKGFSPIMTPQASIEVMAVLDTMRAQIGLTYPGE